MSLLLNPRLLASLALAFFLAFTHFTAYRKGSAHTQAKWDAAKVQQQAETQAQAERNRELQRKAETKYVVEAATRDRFIVQTVKEIHELAAPLADCPVPEPLRLRLNQERSCALGDSPAACGADGSVRQP